MLVHNPYEGIDWQTVTQHVGNTHMHGRSFARLMDYYGLGIRVMAFSNYFPEESTCPLEEHIFGGEIPGDIICVPNSEQHGVSDAPIHFSALASTVSNDEGTGLGWQDSFDQALSELVWADGGGIIINHPVWSEVDLSTVLAMLDHDDRVLGIEIRNNTTENNDYPTPRDESAVPMWDQILATGRRCWGFAATDHYLAATPNYGRSILLLSEATAEAAAAAWRSGQFFAALYGTLTVVSIEVDNHLVTVATDAADTITMTTEAGDTVKAGPVAEFVVPAEAVYCRLTAEGAGDTVWTQPLTYSGGDTQEETSPPTAQQALRRRLLLRSFPQL